MLMVVPMPQRAEYYIVGAEAFAASCGARQDGPVVSGVGVGNALLLEIDHAIKESNEFPGNAVGGDYLIDAIAELARFRDLGRERTYRCLQVGHEQRRANAFAHHVGNADAKLVLGYGNHIIVVAAHGAS